MQFHRSVGLPLKWRKALWEQSVFPITQHNASSQGSNQDRSIRSPAHYPWGHCSSTNTIWVPHPKLQITNHKPCILQYQITNLIWLWHHAHFEVIFRESDCKTVLDLKPDFSDFSQKWNFENSEVDTQNKRVKIAIWMMRY